MFCTLNFVKYLGMIDGDLELPERQVLVKNYVVYRSLAGGFYLKGPAATIGWMVTKGQLLAQVIDPVTLEVVETCESRVNGKPSVPACRYQKIPVATSPTSRTTTQ